MNGTSIFLRKKKKQLRRKNPREACKRHFRYNTLWRIADDERYGFGKRRVEENISPLFGDPVNNARWCTCPLPRGPVERLTVSQTLPPPPRGHNGLSLINSVPAFKHKALVVDPSTEKSTRDCGCVTLYTYVVLYEHAYGGKRTNLVVGSALECDLCANENDFDSWRIVNTEYLSHYYCYYNISSAYRDDNSTRVLTLELKATKVWNVINNRFSKKGDGT